MKKTTKIKKRPLVRHKKQATKQPTVQEQLGALAKSMCSRLDAEAAADRRHTEESEDWPMISDPVWHEHKQ